MTHKSVRVAVLLLLPAIALACDSGTDAPVPASVDLIAEIDVLPAGQTWQLETIVLDENDDPITNPDVSYSSGNESIATVSDDGVVTGIGDGDVEITATAGAAQGNTSLFVYNVADLCTTGLRLVPDEPVRASLQTGDCDFSEDDDTFVDLWFFDLTQQTAVTLEMTAPQLNAYLFLYDDAVTLVADDDNSAGGTDARVTATLEAGRYWVLANHWPDVSTGVYTITLSTGGSALLAPNAMAPADAPGARTATFTRPDVRRR